MYLVFIKVYSKQRARCTLYTFSHAYLWEFHPTLTVTQSQIVTAVKHNII